MLGFVAEHGARIRAQVLDVVLREPALHFADRVTVFLRMSILIAQPGLPSRRLGLSRAQDRIERDQSETRQARDELSSTRGQPRERIVDADDRSEEHTSELQSLTN